MALVRNAGAKRIQEPPDKWHLAVGKLRWVQTRLAPPKPTVCSTWYNDNVLVASLRSAQYGLESSVAYA